ncbi:hypothetical protein BDP27DRAFT_1322777 [Rhodocollybia butyracea]|uniref:Uncharacterized protein n=1 Tax=Rhodocollybia butyracea TaxID=206335 RepID=A0A9P5PZX2_9AGAR|nr:hypothetical protein BDP27DRAFT_1322777 [Rhodocollybia butyracea]
MEVDYPSMTPSIQPDSVEEPLTPSPSVPEIRMKGFSWYEPEPDRIVVTDLDSSDDEEEKETEPAVVLPALLDRIRQREQDQSIPLPLLPDQQALVLYQPVKKLPEVEEEKERSVDMMDIE